MNLSRRTYTLAAFITLLGIAGQWWMPAYGLWRLPAGVLVFALAGEWLLHCRRAPVLTRFAPPRAVPGEPFDLQLRVDHPGPGTLRIEAEQALASGLAAAASGKETNTDFLEPVRLRCPSGERRSHSWQVYALNLGRLHWPPVYARVLGRFGLGWWPSRVDTADTLEVVPAWLRGKLGSVGSRDSEGVAHRAGGPGQELLSLREYRPGDGLRTIDWKATARSGRRMVRLYSEDQHLSLIIVIDSGRGSGIRIGRLARLAHYTNLAGRLAELAAHNGDAVGLVAYADRPLLSIPPDTGLRGVRRMREGLAGLQTQARESNPLPACLEAGRLMRRRSLVVLFGELDEGEGAEQLVRAMALLTPKHLPLVASLRDDEVEAMTRRSGDHWRNPYHALAAYRLLQAREDTAYHIRRMGGHVVLAHHQRLDEAVLGYYRALRERRSI